MHGLKNTDKIYRDTQLASAPASVQPKTPGSEAARRSSPSAITSAAPRDDDDGDRPMKLQQGPPPIIDEPPLLSKTTKLGRRWCRSLGKGPDTPPALDPKPNPEQPSPSSLLPPSSAVGSSSSELYPAYWHLLLPDEADCRGG